SLTVLIPALFLAVRLALLGGCQFTNRARATAHLYADAFANAPSLADDLGAGHRYNAARAAALAAWRRKLDGDPTARLLVQKTMTRWRADPDLAGLRQPETLDRLPADEREDCAALWVEIAA